MPNYNTDEIKNEILDGLLQVDSSFLMTSFDMNIDKKTRHAEIQFTAETDSGEEISEVITYA